MSEPQYNYGGGIVSQNIIVRKNTLCVRCLAVIEDHPYCRGEMVWCEKCSIAGQIHATEQPQCVDHFHTLFHVTMTKEARRALADYQTRHELTDQSAAVTIAAIIAKEITK